MLHRVHKFGHTGPYKDLLMHRNERIIKNDQVQVHGREIGVFYSMQIENYDIIHVCDRIIHAFMKLTILLVMNEKYDLIFSVFGPSSSVETSYGERRI